MLYLNNHPPTRNRYWMQRELINIHLHTSIYILFLSYWFTLDVYICLILFDIIFSIMRYWHEIWVQYKHLLLFLLQWLCRVVFWWCHNTGNYILYHHYCISIHYTHTIHYPCIFLFCWKWINYNNFESLDFVLLHL